MTEDELDETEVSTRPFCSMLMIVAPDGVSEPLARPADTPVNVTVPQLARGTSELPSEKSSTIHSAFCWQSAGWPENVCDTCWPVEWLMSVAVPPVRDVATTEAVIESPALRLNPVKSCAKSGNHSNQAVGGGEVASGERRPRNGSAASVSRAEAISENRSLPSNEVRDPEIVKSTPVWRMALPQVSPSIPTHAEAEWVPEPPEGSRGVGTVKVPVTDLNVF